MTELQRYAGMTALLSGGGTGIGAEVARRLAQEGANVVLMGRRREPLEAMAREFGGMVVVGDAANTSDVKQAIAAVHDAFGRIDILIANAGGHGVGPTFETSDEDWALATRLNLDTAFVCARECLPDLIKTRGNIVIVASIAGLFAGPAAVGYVTMKHGCIGLGKSLARDFGCYGVRTNTICPGWVSTAMADEQMEALMQKYNLPSGQAACDLVIKDVPAGCPVTPADVAKVICFVASDKAVMMNGAIVTVDGGSSVVDLPTLAFYDAPEI
jgi:meso-butanediol dehydrogenase / (S,S)-butanediol dehydrogenase / diacetyl reductase